MSTGAILVRFDGGTIMNFEPPFDDLTYLDKYGVVTAMSLSKALSMGRDDIARRLQYTLNQLYSFTHEISKSRR